MDPRELYRRDPLFRLFKDKLHLHDICVVAGIALLTLGTELCWVIVAGRPFDPLRRFLEISIFPLCFGIYLSLPASVADLFNALRSDEIIGAPRQDGSDSMSYENYLKKFVSWMDSIWWVVVALTCIVGSAFYIIFLGKPVGFSLSKILPPAPLWLQMMVVVITAFNGYVVILSFVRLLIVCVFINRLFHLFAIDIKLLHPDGSGGLGGLVRILWFSIGIMLAVALRFLSANLHFFSTLEITLLIAVYFVLIPLILISWLLLPHLVMLKARKTVLQPLAHEFQQAVKETTPSEKNDTATIVADTERLSALNQRYELLWSKFPTWPLQLSAVRGLVAALSLPAVVAFLLDIVDLLKAVGIKL